MGSIFGGMAFLVGTSYSEMAGAVKSASSSSDSFLYMVLVVVVIVIVVTKAIGRDKRRGSSVGLFARIGGSIMDTL
jgi:hypothetical protein